MTRRTLFVLTDRERAVVRHALDCLATFEPRRIEGDSPRARELVARLDMAPRLSNFEIGWLDYAAGDLLDADPAAAIDFLGEKSVIEANRARDTLRRLFKVGKRGNHEH